MQFVNGLVDASSPHLQQHADTPVFWYPWGEEAVRRARIEDKPILLSIGYSTCYACHVMERDVFRNLSIASLMNRLFINIKLDAEEYPELDAIFMTARQLLTSEGGWPNTLLLTPDLKPFFAGGAYGPADVYGKPAFPRVLEWANYTWQTEREEAQRVAQRVSEDAQRYLAYVPAASVNASPAGIFTLMKQHYDASGGGFFQAPKFPHECYLSFLLGYRAATGDAQALDMAVYTLEKMAAGGIYDHVACGFHRYAIDKEWYVPHFEKMLYNQALLARVFTDAARLAGNAHLAAIARSVLDFVSGPLTDGQGGFYASVDSEINGIAGAYYAWSAEAIQAELSPEQVAFFTTFYALADIPKFPGHPHPEGEVIIARQPLPAAARQRGIPYVAVAAMSGQVMNILLKTRNLRQSPNLDSKIILSWNGLMIDAYAHAGLVFSEPRYTALAREAAEFLLEHMFDNDGGLQRIYINKQARLAATLEDYAFFIKGLISLYRADGDGDMRDAALSLAEAVGERFGDAQAPGYFLTQTQALTPLRVKNAGDTLLPNGNAVMAHNFIDLAEVTGNQDYHARARAIVDYFMAGIEPAAEYATMAHAALRLAGERADAPRLFDDSLTMEGPMAPLETVSASAEIMPHGDGQAELAVTLVIAAGWYINAHAVATPFAVATQLGVAGAQMLDVAYPDAVMKTIGGDALPVYEGQVVIRARVALPAGAQPALAVQLRLQPCREGQCHAIRDITISV